MILAVTYDRDGQIFQHFGKTEYFKLYNIEDGELTRCTVIGSDGQGHGALAGVLSAHDVDALICGDIGPGAVNALAAMNITCYPGNSGSADDAVKAFLKGELTFNSEATCDHHHDHECDHDSNHCCH
ncbi:MAG: NifB/NifX family molybdenum-iron cluster-binding protein [Erysipelotrichaceae bacterium]|nr:NifB/NifX family molybdenum-iron cluster-binding protein [Erysipelotrichaceae bacterium]